MNNSKLWEEVVTYCLPYIYPEQNFDSFFCDEPTDEQIKLKEESVGKIFNTFNYKTEYYNLEVNIDIESDPNYVGILAICDTSEEPVFSGHIANMNQLITLFQILDLC